MATSNNYRFLNANTQDTLENRRREQEERKMMLMREQKTKELKQLETQLFYKQQEVERLKTISERLRREQVQRQTKQIGKNHEVNANKNALKDTESMVQKLETEIGKTLADIAEKISSEKQIIAQHQKNLEDLEKKKREFESKNESKKKMLISSVSRLLFIKKSAEGDFKNADKLFQSGQKQIAQIEESLKVFTQETIVLQNKIRALQALLKQII